jgi:prepilin-type N-terminal cleavage/methylation domain-containing protein
MADGLMSAAMRPAKSPGIASSSESGFSLIELLIAITVTLIISGAIFGLMGSGQTRFKAEPALSERQQNIRLAMDLIQRDVATAGNKMDDFHQVFRTFGNAATGLTGPGRANGDLAGNDNSDILVIWGNDGECPDIPGTPAGADFAVIAGFSVPPCYRPSQPVIVRTSTGPAVWGWASSIPQPPSAGGLITFNTGLSLPAPDGAGTQVNGAGSLNNAVAVASLSMIRYQIAYVPGVGNGAPVPNLYRSASGGYDAAGGVVDPPNGLGTVWQLVASGIEDLQVVYEMADGTPADVPVTIRLPGTANPDPAYLDIVRSVRVTLSSRVVVMNPADVEASYSPENIAAMNALSPNSARLRRGSLTATFTPRAALGALSRGDIVPPAVRWN